jgi:3-methyladenine DNA glycosylase AlkC
VEQPLLAIPDVTGLGWSKVRAIARELAATYLVDDLVEEVMSMVDAPEIPRRLLAVYVLGYASGQRPENLNVLHDKVPPDPSWEVQEALAQAFDAYCAAVGYESALPVIDVWLSDPHPNARRAVSEGLRPWAARGRAYFALHPDEAISRLAALRADESDYVRHSAGNALRDIRRAHSPLVDAETATWHLDDPREAFTYQRVLARR